MLFDPAEQSLKKLHVGTLSQCWETSVRMKFSERDLSSKALALPTPMGVEMQSQKAGSSQCPLSRELHSTKTWLNNYVLLSKLLSILTKPSSSVIEN